MTNTPSRLAGLWRFLFFKKRKAFFYHQNEIDRRFYFNIMIIRKKSCTIYSPFKSLTIMKQYLFILCAVFFVESALAQDFWSIYERVPLEGFRSIGISVSPQQFLPRENNSLPDSLRIQFNSAMPCIEYRQLDLRIAIGYNTYELSGEKKSAYSLYAESATDIALGSKRSALFLPIIIATNYIRAESVNKLSRRFDVGSVGIGTGLKYRSLSESFGVQAYAGGVIYYSTAGFSIENGSSTSLRAEIDFLLPHIVSDGIIFGYRFESQAWSLSDARLNYSRVYHGPFIGIFF